MKKLISLVVVVVLIMAMTVPALAALPEVVEPQACTHPSRTLITVSHRGYSYFNENYCMKYDEYAYRCNNSSCYAVFTVIDWLEDAKEAHYGYINNATCNGTTQTWYYRYNPCGSSYTKQVTCPGQHGSGPCDFLPV